MAIKESKKTDLIENIIEVRRVAKVIKGGRSFSFSALAVVGDGRGQVGHALGKANEVIEAVRKAKEKAKKSMRPYALYKNTIPHAILAEFGAGKVLLQPAPPGSGIIAASAIRSLVEALGIKDINAKVLGSCNSHNMVKATLNGLSKMRTFEETARLRNKPVEEVCLMPF